jgi:hypothetical protein
LDQDWIARKRTITTVGNARTRNVQRQQDLLIGAA